MSLKTLVTSKDPYRALGQVTDEEHAVTTKSS